VGRPGTRSTVFPAVSRTLWHVRIEWHPVLDDGGCGISAVPQEYDGHPTPDLLKLDYSPRFAAPTRLALAAVLAFRPYISGALQLPQPVSPEVADGIREILRPHEVFPEPIEYHPKAIPTGPGTFRLQDSPTAVKPGSPAGPLDLVLVDTARVFGHHLEGNVATMPTNASLLAPGVSDPLDRLLPSLAVAVLLAEDFGVGAIELPAEAAGGKRYVPVVGALAASGLALATGERVDEADQAVRRRSTAPFSTSSSS
jgi:hypothetical protein